MRIRLSILSLFVLSLWTKTEAQESYNPDLFFDITNYGTIKSITDKPVANLVIFASKKGNQWSKKGKKAMIKKQSKALKLIKRQVKSYEIGLDINTVVINPEKDVWIDEFIKTDSANNYENKLVETVWKGLDQAERSDFESYKGGFFVSLFINDLGSISASPDFTQGEAREYPEFVSLYRFDRNYLKLRYITIAHEILHLYGAWDLYFMRFKGLAKEDHLRMKEYYPNSIMLVKKKEIDDFTAWKIGLPINPKPWFKEIKPAEVWRISNYDQN